MVRFFLQHKLTIFSALGIFILALLPRTLGLGVFLTVDEQVWWENTKNFAGGIIDPHFACPGVTENDAAVVLAPTTGLACTLRAAHPGVTTMWNGSLGIWLYYLSTDTSQSLVEFVQQLGVHPIDKDSIVWLRLPTALLSALFPVLVFLILLKILSDEPASSYWLALIAAIFIALSPFNIALSRVLHTDATETIFLTLALLTALYYWLRRPSRRWLLLSGALGGASFLSKNPALFLCPFIILIEVWYLGKLWFAEYRGKKIVKAGFEVVLEGLLWFSAALIVMFLLWPALWTIPGTVIDFVTEVTFGYATRGHEKGNFFWGTISHDPGPFFYPLTWLLHVTPWVFIGVVVGVFFWFKWPYPQTQMGRSLKGLRVRLGYSPSIVTVELLFFFLFLFVILFTVFLSLSTKKQDRYLLPVYPSLEIMAAIGWVWFIPKISSFIQLRRSKKPAYYFLSLIGLILLTNIFWLVRTFPYYFTYFNPMLGGGPVAARLITLGWGEGLDLAADYLNQKPEARNLNVVSWYGPYFSPFFVGEGSDYFQDKGRVLGADYVIVYLNQRQRQLPDPEFFDFLDTKFKPETIFSFNDVPYVWVYPGLKLDHYLENQRYEDVAELLGWEYTTPGIDPDHPVLRPGDSLEFDLWWEYLGKSVEEPFFLWLVGPDSRIWAETLTQPKPEAGQPADWTSGKMIPETGRLVIPPGTPPGDYTIYIGFYPENDHNPAQALLFDLGDNPRTVTIARGSMERVPSLIPLNIRVGPLRLVGWQFSDADIKLDEFNLELYWQPLQNVSERYQVSLALLDKTGTSRWEWPRTDPVSFYPTSGWTKDELVRSQLSAQPTLRTPGGQYQLALNIYTGEELLRTVPLLPVTIPGLERQFTLTDQMSPAQALFDDGIILLGFQTETKPVYHPGDKLTIRLYWQAQQPVELDYTVFVQLVGQDGQIYGQMDAQPHNGDHPTNHWTPGEIVQDSYSFAISPDAAPGNYKLIVGLYQFETGQRLRLAQSDQTYYKVLDLPIQ